MPILILGLSDPWVAAAILLSVLITAVCAIYGFLNWNKGDDSAPGTETIIWVRDERSIDEKL